MVHDPVSAVPDNQRDAHGADEINQRKEDRIIEDRVDVRFAMLIVDVRKARD